MNSCLICWGVPFRLVNCQLVLCLSFLRNSLQSPFIHFGLRQLPGIATKTNINFYISFKLIYLKPVTGQTITWNDNVLKHWCFLWNQNGLCMFWLLYVTCNGFSMTGIMDSHWHLIKNLKCEQFMKFDKRHGKLWSIADCWRKFPRLVWPTFWAVDMTQQTSPPSPANAENTN